MWCVCLCVCALRPLLLFYYVYKNNFERESFRASLIVRDPSNNEQDTMPSPIVFATTVRNAEEHVARCVDALRGYANTTPGARHHLYVYESGSTDRTRDAWRSAALSLRGTFARSELVDRTFPADNSTQAWPRCDGKLCPGGNRACRLAAIRQQLKQHIAVRRATSLLHPRGGGRDDAGQREEQ